MGIHPFGDRSIVDDFDRVTLQPSTLVEFHDYAAEWTEHESASTSTSELVREVAQSPAYPMQLMLGIYEFADGSDAGVSRPGSYPKEFLVDWVRGWRRTG